MQGVATEQDYNGQSEGYCEDLTLLGEPFATSFRFINGLCGADNC